MFEVDIVVYVNALFILMISSISSYIFIVHKLRNNNYPGFSLRYYNLYFIVGVIGWVGLWIKDSGLIKVDLASSVIAYLLVSSFLLLAVLEVSCKKWNDKVIAIIHGVGIILSLFLDDDFERLVYISLYTLLVYPVIAFLSFKLAHENNNIGNGIIGAAATLVVF